MKRNFKFSHKSEDFHPDPYEELRKNKRTKNLQRVREQERLEAFEQEYYEDREEDYIIV